MIYIYNTYNNVKEKKIQNEKEKIRPKIAKRRCRKIKIRIKNNKKNFAYRMLYKTYLIKKKL